jgi:hypothetical protein
MADKTNNQLQVILKEQHVDKEQAEALVKAFGGPFDEAGEILATYKDIKVTDIKDTEGMQAARTKRLALKKARTTVENKRKELKEGIVKQGRAIDSIARYVKEQIAPAEEYLQLQEDYAKLQAKQQHEAMLADRRDQLGMRGVQAHLYNYEGMTNDEFTALLAELDAEAKRKADEAAAAEAERIKQEQADKAAQAQRDLEAKRVRSLMVLGFTTNDNGVLSRKGFDTGLVEAELLPLDDKAFDDKVNAAIKTTDKQFDDEAEARKAEQLAIEAAAKKQTERINEITGYGARYNAEIDGYELGTLSTTIALIEKMTDAEWANTVAMFKKISDELAEAAKAKELEDKKARETATKLQQEQREREARDKAAKEKAEADERAAMLAPDKTKLLTLADGLEMVRTSKLPALKTKQAQEIVNDIDADLTRLIANVRAKADRLK